MSTLDLPTTTKLYKTHLESRKYASYTVSKKIHLVNVFFEYLRKTYSWAGDIREVTKEDIFKYAKYLVSVCSLRTGNLITPTTRRVRLSEVRLFFQFLYKRGVILFNPATGSFLTTKATPSTKVIFTKEEMAQFLDSIEGNEPGIIRDRAFFELMYSSGLRKGEARKLKLEDLDMEQKICFIRRGKGGKDRLVPFSNVAHVFLKRLLDLYPHKTEIDTVFDNFSTSTVQKNFKKWLQISGISKVGLTIHSIRYSTATHLLEAGVDLRFVQELLGHRSIETTVKYTHLETDKLKITMRTYHPRENDMYEELGDSYRVIITELKSLSHQSWRNNWSIISKEKRSVLSGDT